jgi:hypothetical protein
MLRFGSFFRKAGEGGDEVVTDPPFAIVSRGY